MVADQVLSFDEFVALFESTLGTSLPAPAAEAVLGIDFAISSVQMLDLIVELEDFGAEMPPEAFLEARSLADIHEEYLAMAARASL